MDEAVSCNAMNGDGTLAYSMHIAFAAILLFSICSFVPIGLTFEVLLMHSNWNLQWLCDFQSISRYYKMQNKGLFLVFNVLLQKFIKTSGFSKITIPLHLVENKPHFPICLNV